MQHSSRADTTIADGTLFSLTLLASLMFRISLSLSLSLSISVSLGQSHVSHVSHTPSTSLTMHVILFLFFFVV